MSEPSPVDHHVIWERPGSMIRGKILATILLLVLAPFWTEAIRFAIISLLGQQSFRFLGVFPVLGVPVAEAVVLIIAGLGGLGFTLGVMARMWHHGFQYQVIVVPQGLKRTYDGLGMHEKLIPWSEYRGVELIPDLSGMACVVHTESTRSWLGRKPKNRTIVLAVLSFGTPAEQIMETLRCAYQAYLRSKDGV